MKQATEIVINSTLLTEDVSAIFYEFVLGVGLEVVECGCIESLSQSRLRHIAEPVTMLDGMLFELNHVRVNPEADNTLILARLAKALEKSGVTVKSAPHAMDSKMCFKPLGELSDVVRFYVNAQGRLTFLSSSVKLQLVSSQSS